MESPMRAAAVAGVAVVAALAATGSLVLPEVHFALSLFCCTHRTHSLYARSAFFLKHTEAHPKVV